MFSINFITKYGQFLLISKPRLKGREERERMLGVGDDYQDLFGDDEQEYIDSKFTNQQIQVLYHHIN